MGLKTEKLCTGAGIGYGYGDVAGAGYGDGDGTGAGAGYGSVAGYGAGAGYGAVAGYGDGDGDVAGAGYGFDSNKIKLLFKNAFTAYHYIKKDGDGFITRSGQRIKIGDTLSEKTIELCIKGLHASFTPEEAMKYAPTCSVLTKVKVWGTIIFDKDKMVATHRRLIKEVNEVKK